MIEKSIACLPDRSAYLQLKTEQIMYMYTVQTIVSMKMKIAKGSDLS